MLYDRKLISALLKEAGEDSDKLFSRMPEIEAGLTETVILPLVNDAVAKNNIKAYVEKVAAALGQYYAMSHALDVWKANNRKDPSPTAKEAYEKLRSEIGRLEVLTAKFRGLENAYARHGIASAVDFVTENSELNVLFE